MPHDVQQPNEALDEKAVDEKCYEDWRPWSGATSFGEVSLLQEAREQSHSLDRLNMVFQDLVSNILHDEDVADKQAALGALIDEYTSLLQKPVDDRPSFFKSLSALFQREPQDPYSLTLDHEKRTGPAMKRVNNIDFPARDFAYVPDASKPATWRILMTAAPGKSTVDSLTRAAQALDGQKSLVPTEALSSVKRRIRQEFRKLGVAEGKIPPIVKIDDATPRTGPAARAAKQGGEAPLDPQERTSFFVFKDKDGQYRWFAVYSNNYRDDDVPAEIIAAISHETFTKAVDRGLFPYPELWLWHEEKTLCGVADWVDWTGTLALASGTFYDERVAKNLADYPDPLGVSHGMPVQYIVRDTEDPSVILFHVTKEISPLPVGAAANKLTGFVVLKEQDTMGVSDSKKSFLQRVLPEDLYSGLIKATEGAEDKAAESGREQKDVSETPEASETQPEYVTAEQFTEAMQELLEPVVKSLASLAGHIKAQNEQIASLHKSLAAAATTQEMTPKASLAARVAESLNLGEELPSTAPEVKPKETPVPVTAGGTGLTKIDQLIENSRRYGALNGRN